MYGGELTVGINVTSEIKPLKKVFLHRPGKEIENLTAMNVVTMDVIVKNVYVPGKEEV